MHLRPAIVSVILLAIPGALLHAAEQAEKPTPIGTSSIHLPKGWIIKSATDTMLSARAPTPDKDDSPGTTMPPADAAEYSPAVSVKIQNFTGEIDPAAQQKLLASSFDKYRTIEKPAPISIGDAKGYVFGGTFAVGKIQLRSRHYMLTANNKLYVIAFTTLASRWADHQAEFDAAAKSFTPGK